MMTISVPFWNPNVIIYANPSLFKRRDEEILVTLLIKIPWTFSSTLTDRLFSSIIMPYSILTYPNSRTGNFLTKS